MRNLVLLVVALVAVCSMSSCKIQAPVFKGVENVKFERVGTTGIKFGSEAVFYNPNRVRCKVSDIALDVLMDSKNVATIGEKADIVVKGRTDFRVPMGVMLNPQGTIFENFMKILDIFRDKETTLTLQGNVKVKAYCVTVPVKIKYEQKVKLTQLKGK